MTRQGSLPVPDEILNQLEIFRVFERFVVDVGCCIRASTREHVERPKDRLRLQSMGTRQTSRPACPRSTRGDRPVSR